ARHRRHRRTPYGAHAPGAGRRPGVVAHARRSVARPSRRRRRLRRRRTPRHARDVQLLDIPARGEPHASARAPRGGRTPADRRTGAPLRHSRPRAARRRRIRRRRRLRRGPRRARARPHEPRSPRRRRPPLRRRRRHRARPGERDGDRPRGRADPVAPGRAPPSGAGHRDRGGRRRPNRVCRPVTQAAFDAQAPALEPDLTRPLPRSLRALSFHDFRVFWVGAIGSSIGNNMQLAALLWVVAVATRSAAKVTLIAFITVVPLLLLGAVGGALADRFPRRRLLLVTQTLLMIQAFALWGLWEAGLGSYWVLFTVSLAGGVLIA